MAKHDLIFQPALMNASGSLGFSPDPHSTLDWSIFGAFVTNPVSLSARTPARGRRFVAYPGGFMLHTGFPNPGIQQVIRRHATRWSRSPLPVIVHLLTRNASEINQMARRLENIEGVSGLEVGIASDAGREMVAAIVQASAGELSVIVRLPMERAAELARVAIDAGAAMVSLAPPRGIIPLGNTELTQGRLYGPAVLPIALRVVAELVNQGIPTIGAGGVYSQAGLDAMMVAGAVAVQLDSLLWLRTGRNPLR